MNNSTIHTWPWYVRSLSDERLAQLIADNLGGHRHAAALREQQARELARLQADHRTHLAAVRQFTADVRVHTAVLKSVPA